MTTAIRIRPANPGDVEAISRISMKTFYDSFADQNSKEDMEAHLQAYYSLEQMEKEIADRLNIFLMAFIGDELVGYAKINKHIKPEWEHLEKPIEIERIYAVKEWIGKGIGKRLMEECIAISRQEGRKTIWLGVWEKNFSAMEFYKRWGFEKFGEHPFYVGEDRQTDWLLKKVIDPAS